MIIILTDEFGANVWLFAQTIKYFKDNVGPYRDVHAGGRSVIETVYGDLFYVKETCEEIGERLFSAQNKSTNEEAL